MLFRSKVIDIYRELGEYGIEPIVVDPAADAGEAKHLYGIEFKTMDDIRNVDALVIAVAHEQFLSLDREKISSFYDPKHKRKVLMDLKGILNRKEYLTEDFLYWRL